MSDLHQIRARMAALHFASDREVLDSAEIGKPPASALRAKVCARAADLVRDIRAEGDPGLMESFLAEYGLSTDEGVALMCLAEALLRVPDATTMDALIEDKIAPSEWGKHLGHSSSSLVNASTWALMLTGKVLADDEGEGIAATLHAAVKRLGEPVIRTAVTRAIKELGHQFVLGRTIKEAVERGGKLHRKGYRFSYDMLGEAALTEADARKYALAYEQAISALAKECRADSVAENPGISVKLSALHPRYEEAKNERVLRELVPVLKRLCRLAAKAGMGLNIDAEESERLEISLDVIEAVLKDPDLAGWDGFGIVVQAYGKRAAPVIDWLYALAVQHDRRIMLRLVKGAYWDSEIKKAQVEGAPGFPVFAQKSATDRSYIQLAAKLFAMQDRIYPQFATHNAHSVAAVLEMAPKGAAFEFQRLQGMGEALHARVMQQEKTRCRIYAPVGTHRDLLAYLVRRLLENGANSSFVNQIVDLDVPAEIVAADPFEVALHLTPLVRLPEALFAPERRNSAGWDLRDRHDLARLDAARLPFAAKVWSAGPLTHSKAAPGALVEVMNPAKSGELVGRVTYADLASVATVLKDAQGYQPPSAEKRKAILERAADLYEAHSGELFALLTREAGKTPLDAVAEMREAVDFLRYYAGEGVRNEGAPRGVVTCISPWNFPLAIFTGQISAALAAGNAVIAKPAEATCLVAHRAVQLLHEAGVASDGLQMLPGLGVDLGRALVNTPGIDGVCFTGSTRTAQMINCDMAANLAPEAFLIAETGGLNAMIVDSTALPEQAIRDIVVSAFQSAGQRCSALRVLYLQEDIADGFKEMLFGAMDELVTGDPWDFTTDIGPVISEAAQKGILDYIASAHAEGRVMKRIVCPDAGHFVPGAVISVNGIADLEREVFGPVLHIATFKANALDQVISQINASGYGLTFGLHTRIDDRVEQVTRDIRVGNIYVNRNQIGAIVGSQPFGGEGLSGTGPKAGGARYVPRFLRPEITEIAADTGERMAPQDQVQKALAAAVHQRRVQETLDLPGPTGESNRYSVEGRGVVLCLGPGAKVAREQAETARLHGCSPVMVAEGLGAGEGVEGRLHPEMLGDLEGFDVVAHFGEMAERRALRQALAGRDGPLVPLASGGDLAALCLLERHVCVDTTAAGGNASLLAAVGED